MLPTRHSLLARMGHVCAAVPFFFFGSIAVRAQPSSEERPLPERVTCSLAAAAQYSVPANLVLAVAELEGGKPGQWVQNRNGSFDVGAMQFNTRYLRELARYGITPANVAAAGCYAYELATWRIARHLANDAGDLWQRAANYHSRTEIHNARYRRALKVRAARWAAWLKARFRTREFVSAEVHPRDPPPPAAAHPVAPADGVQVIRRLPRSAARARAGDGRAIPAEQREQPTWVRASGPRVTTAELEALRADALAMQSRP